MPPDEPQKPKFYLTTPIYYVNARPHIGHAYTTIVADVLARRHRLGGDDTFFLTGTDEHGQKIERSAAAAGIPPQQFADEVSAQFRALWDRMGLTYNKFIRTTDPAHKQGAQQLFRELYNRGFIYLSTYTGSYCVSDEAFVDLPPGTPCPDCGRLLETVTEENFFFKLSEFQKELIELVEERRDGSPPQLLITPDSARNEVLSFLRGGLGAYYPELERELGVKPEDALDGAEVFALAVERGLLQQTKYKSRFRPGALKDLSVSRSSFTWGIPVPPDVQQASGTTQNHIIYVWLDALANYMTAVGYGSEDPDQQKEFHRYWPADLHLVGKEITRFHCVYWPAFLLAAGLPTPEQITANGWLLFDNAKMSKSRGNVVRTETILDAFGDGVYGKQFPDSTKHERDLFAADVLRYFLLREIAFGQDGSFSFDAFRERYNADLTNGYGNLVSRVLTMVKEQTAGAIPDGRDMGGWRVLTIETALEDHAQLVAINLSEEFREGRFTRVVTGIQSLVGVTDRFISDEAPWRLAKSNEASDQSRLRGVLYAATQAIRIITALLYPILPYATAKVWQQLGLGDIEAAARNGELNNLQWGGLPPGTKLGPLSPIFPRADKSLAQVMIAMEDARNTPTRLPIQEATNIPMATEAGLPAAKIPGTADAGPKPSTDPAAPPRTSSSDPAAELSGTLPVGGSTAAATTLPTTPGPHTTAPASGPFAPPPQPATGHQTPTTGDTITIDDFLKVDLRAARILLAERIPKADKLLRLEVDLGPGFDPPRRQILSGIAEHYSPEELIGRRIVVVANLAPRKMRGLDSHGMLLAASEGPDGKPILATFGEDIALGSRVR